MDSLLAWVVLALGGLFLGVYALFYAAMLQEQAKRENEAYFRYRR